MFSLINLIALSLNIIVNCFTNTSVLYARFLFYLLKRSRNFCIDLPLAEINIADRDRKIVLNVNCGNLSPL